MRTTHYPVNRTPLRDFRTVRNARPGMGAIVFALSVVAATLLVGIVADMGARGATRPQVGHASYALPTLAPAKVAPMTRLAHCWC